MGWHVSPGLDQFLTGTKAMLNDSSHDLNSFLEAGFLDDEASYAQ
jgi:hypothetical protein